MNYAQLGVTPDTAIAMFITDEQSARRVVDCVADAFFADELAVSIAEVVHGQWRVTFYFDGEIGEATARELAIAAVGAQKGRALRFQRIAAKDWVADSLRELKPIAAGRFVVHGGHDRGGVPANRIAIEIEAALAFGTGHHGTTRGCLLVLDAICKLLGDRRMAVPRILDLGTGTGVLAIAAARSLRRRVLASDIDAQAVRIARDNARLNRAVFANILLGPLQKLAAPLRAVVAPRGRLVLSGLLKSQANAALAAYRKLTLERRIELDGWTTLVLRRKR